MHAAAGGAVGERFLDFVYQPLKDAAGAVTGIFVVGADVTERTRAHASLRQSEARFRAALKAGRMGSWETDHTTRTRLWSAEGMALFGIDLPEGRGRLGGPDDEYVRALHPDDRHLAARFQALADKQDSFAAEYRVVRADGSVRWLSGHGSVTARGPDGKAQRLISIMADVTEAHQAMDMLRMERERLRLALGAGQMGAYELDVAADKLWWSPETFDLFGVDRDAFVPTREGVLALVHPDDRAGFVERRTKAIAQRLPFFDEVRIRRPDGTQAWIGYRGHAEYDAQDRLARTFGIVLDITDRKNAEQVLRDADRAEGRVHRHLVARAAQSARADPQRHRRARQARPRRRARRLVPRRDRPPDRADGAPARRPARRRPPEPPPA